MLCLLAVALLPLYFTAPADTLRDAAGRVSLSPEPARAYLFYRLSSNGVMASIPGYADATGNTVLKPHIPGTRETVWIDLGAPGRVATIYVLSVDANGNLSTPSNGLVVGPRALLAASAIPHARTSLDVPVLKQARERCGQAALAMVLRYYGADGAALSEVDAAYDPALHGSLITDLATAARRAGYEADVAQLTPDSLIDLLNDGVPPIVLYQNGSGPATFRHFGVVTGWDASRASFTLHDGTARPRVTRRGELVKQWETAGSLALIVRQRTP